MKIKSIKTANKSKKSLYEIRDGTVVLNFHRGQQEAWNSEKRFVFVIAGSQSGKTAFSPWWLYREFQRGLERGIPTPIDMIAVTSTYSLFRNKMLPELRRVFEDVLGIGEYVAKESIMYLYRRGSSSLGRIILVSAVNPQGLEAATAWAAWGDEVGQDAFSEEVFNVIQRRLAIYQGRFLATTTPYNFGWLYRVWLDWKKYKDKGEDHPLYDIISFPSYYNPAFPKDEFERLKNELPEWYFKMFYEGQFVKPPNIVFDVFDEGVHVINPFDIPNHWPVYAGVDFGAQNTFVVFVAHDEDNDRYYVVDYYEGGRRTTEEHVASVMNMGYELHEVWGGSKAEDQFRWDWSNAGLDVSLPPVSDVVSGLNRINRLLREGRLFIFRHVTPLINEMQSYSYNELYDKASQSYKAIYRKRHYHAIDALRYVVVGLEESSVQAAFYIGPDDEDLAFEGEDVWA